MPLGTTPTRRGLPPSLMKASAVAEELAMTREQKRFATVTGRRRFMAEKCSGDRMSCRCQTSGLPASHAAGPPTISDFCVLA